MSDSVEFSSDDELIRLITSNSDTVSQYVIFKSGNGIFAINVSKVEELIEYSVLNIVNSVSASGIAFGSTKLREHIVTLVDFNHWIGQPSITNDRKKLVMICSYGGKRIGLVIDQVFGIQHVDASTLTDFSKEDKKVQYVSEVIINKQHVLCMVFDTDVLLVDVFPMLQGLQNASNNTKPDPENNVWKQRILVAEDSRIIQAALSQLFDAKEANYKMFINGQELWNYLRESDDHRPDIIISDVEMPIMDGLVLLKNIREDASFKHIPVVMNTNMARSTLIDQATRLGANAVILKPDLEGLVCCVESILSHKSEHC